jgi:hypothetical protein
MFFTGDSMGGHIICLYVLCLGVSRLYSMNYSACLQQRMRATVKIEESSWRKWGVP